MALLDLAFYATAPLILLSAVLPTHGSATGALSKEISWLTSLLASGGTSGAFALLLSCIVLRIIGTKVSERVFARSVAKLYTEDSEKLLKWYLTVVSQGRNADIPKIRKAINAEVSNLYFGIRVPAAIIVSEFMLLLMISIYATFIFGLMVFLFAGAVGISIFSILYFIRRKSAAVGRARSTFEQQRLEMTEVALSSAFSIGVNGGQQHLTNRFNYLTNNFAYALGQQVVLPHSTKALIDGILVLFVFLLLILVGVSSTPSDMAILGGMSVRVIPSLSRISSYIETMRINEVAVTELSAALDSTNLPSVIPPNEELYRALSSLPRTGMFFVVGASGIGKTTTIKHWITKTQATKSVAFLEQSGFESRAEIVDYLALVGLDEEETKATQQYLSNLGLNSFRLSHLSGGQAKFVQFAAISRKIEDIYVFDEPSVGLDQQLQATMINILTTLSKNALIVVVSHDQAFVDLLAQRASGTIIEVH